VKARRSALLVLVAIAAAACSKAGPRQEIHERRVASAPSRPAVVSVGSRERFGGFDMGAARPGSDDLANVFRYDLPAGWDALPPTNDRLVNLRPAGDSAAACTLSFLQGSAGGLEANVNRWRAQFGAPGLSGEEIAALETHPLLGRDATVVEVHGTFKGMGDTAPMAGFALLGLIVSEPTGSLFLKLTGPEALVATERERFLALAGSLRLAEEHAGAPAGGDPHVHEGEVAPGAAAGGGLSWTAPEGWREMPPRTMREVTFAVGEGAECYIARLASDGGGLVANLDRWCSQFSRPALTPAELDALPRVELLGISAPLLELKGHFEGMDGGVQEDQALLGVACIRPEESVFVKFVGPEAVVRAERERFLAFVKSIAEAP
jgi:hypothetical protein